MEIRVVFKIARFQQLEKLMQHLGIRHQTQNDQASRDRKGVESANF